MGRLKTLILLILSFGFFQSFSQSCFCPSAASCAPCAGGIISITLRFNGAVASTVTARDQIGIVFNSTVVPGAIFAFTGSIPNEKFVGPFIPLTVNGVNNASFSSNCTGGGFIGSISGSFTVVAASSKNGGPICCQPGDVDSQPPVISNCPGAITQPLAGACTLTINWIPPAANDNCSIASFTSTHDPGDEFEIGETTVTYTATDNQGNTATCTFTVTVTYTELPVVSGCPEDIAGIAEDTDDAAITWSEPTFTTRCGSLTVQKTHEPGSRFTVGRTEVIYTATDEIGNSAECRFRVDVAPPELDIEISKLITPDGDGYNDYWIITNLENYPDNHVTVFDRWGSVLFKSSRYDNQSVVWTGTNKDNTLLPTGTYFYVLEINYGGQKIKREGFIELVR